MRIFGRRGHSQGKDLKMGACVVCFRNSKEARVSGQSQPEGKEC